MMLMSRRSGAWPWISIFSRRDLHVVELMTCVGIAACSGSNPPFFENLPADASGQDAQTEAPRDAGADVSIDTGNEVSRDPEVREAAVESGAESSAPCPTCPDARACNSGSDTCASCDCDGSARPPQCTLPTDCADAGKTSLCDGTTGRCVECIVAADCPANQDCANRECVPRQPCSKSLACTQGRVCDQTLQRCVNCVTDVDCRQGEACVASECYRTCAADRPCTPFGLVCDTRRGICAECLDHTDCQANEHCSAGQCVADVCKAGSSKCSDGGVVTCDPAGSGYSTTLACGADQSCIAEGGAASCERKTCVPSQVSCDQAAQKVLRCSADGVSQTMVQDCAADSKVCVDGNCADVVCTAGSITCDANSLHRCNSTGTAETVEPCSPRQYCDADNRLCRPRICSPNQPACSNNVVTQCNAWGSGYLEQDAGPGCGPRTCIDGACVDTIFHEGFDAELGGQWTQGQGAYTTLGVTQSTAALGTKMSLQLTKTAADTTDRADGYTRQFMSTKRPSAISLWLRRDATATTGHSYVVFSTARDMPTMANMASLLHVEIFGSSDCLIYVSGTTTEGASTTASCTTGEWYRVELRNLSWKDGTYDFYLDGVEVAKKINIPGGPSATASVKRIDLFDYSATTAYVDEIDFYPE